MLRGWFVAALVIGLAAPARAAEPDTSGSDTRSPRPRPAAAAPT